MMMPELNDIIMM